MPPDPIPAALALFCLAAAALHLASIALARLRLARPQPRPGPERPPLTILRPVCGLENHLAETLEATFVLDWPDYEILFCVAAPDDPAVALVERLIAAHPGRRARLLVGDDPVSVNPKLNNLVKGWRAAAHPWIAMVDSNVLLPPDYVARLFGTWGADRGSDTGASSGANTGLVSSPAAGVRPEGFAAELECAFLDGYQARWQLAADALGLGFAQGKILFWRRDILDAGGGIAALGAEMAEDVAATKLVRAAGLRVRLAGAPVPQPLGRRSFREVWRRQVRWARVRRMGFPLLYVPEILTGGLLPLAACALAAPGWLPVLALVWYGAEYLLARTAGWPASGRAAAGWLLRDALQPAVWVAGWAGSGFDWRGSRMDRPAAPGLRRATTPH